MRARFEDSDVILCDITVNPFQAALIQNGVMDVSAITDVGDYHVNSRLNEIVSNYQYDEDAEDVMNNDIEFL